MPANINCKVTSVNRSQQGEIVIAFEIIFNEKIQTISVNLKADIIVMLIKNIPVTMALLEKKIQNESDDRTYSMEKDATQNDYEVYIHLPRIFIDAFQYKFPEKN